MQRLLRPRRLVSGLLIQSYRLASSNGDLFYAWPSVFNCEIPILYFQMDSLFMIISCKVPSAPLHARTGWLTFEKYDENNSNTVRNVSNITNLVRTSVCRGWEGYLRRRNIEITIVCKTVSAVRATEGGEEWRSFCAVSGSHGPLRDQEYCDPVTAAADTG